MFPVFRQRVLLVIACLLGSFLAVHLGARWLAPTDVSQGLSLMSTSVGLGLAIVAAVLVLVPAWALGTFVCVTGHPLSGLFVISVSLTALACAGGPISGWIHRTPVPASYKSLMLETFLWAAILTLLTALMLWLRNTIRQARPQLATTDHLGQDLSWTSQPAQAAYAGVLCAAISGALAYVLIPTQQVGQVVGGLILGGTIGGLAGQLVFPKLRNPVGLLLSPALVALAGYALALRYPGPTAFFTDWYRLRLSGLMLVLPIYYASAGLTGVIIGVGWAQALLHGDREEGEELTISALAQGSVLKGWFRRSP